MDTTHQCTENQSLFVCHFGSFSLYMNLIPFIITSRRFLVPQVYNCVFLFQNRRSSPDFSGDTSAHHRWVLLIAERCYRAADLIKALVKHFIGKANNKHKNIYFYWSANISLKVREWDFVERKDGKSKQSTPDHRLRCMGCVLCVTVERGRFYLFFSFNQLDFLDSIYVGPPLFPESPCIWKSVWNRDWNTKWWYYFPGKIVKMKLCAYRRCLINTWNTRHFQGFSRSLYFLMVLYLPVMDDIVVRKIRKRFNEGTVMFTVETMRNERREEKTRLMVMCFLLS